MAAGSVRDWYKHYFATRDVWPHLRGQLQDMMADGNACTAPVDILELARRRRITEVRRVSLASRRQFDARLTVAPDGFQVIVNADHPLVRQRFSVAHEIVHTFFYDVAASPPVRLAPQGDHAEEILCNKGAIELLVPTVTLEASQQLMYRTAQSVLRLADEFEVSPQAMSRRLVDDYWRGTQVLMLRWVDVAESGKPSAYRVQWAADEVPFRMPRGSSLKLGGPILEGGNSGFFPSTHLVVGKQDGWFDLDCQHTRDGMMCVLSEPRASIDQLRLI